MSADSTVILALLFFAAAVLYASVGHGGASAYLAAMALWGIAPAVMRPTALALNILVSLIAAVKFARAGCFSWSLLWPFACTSVPLAFVGGAVSLPNLVYRPIVGVVLLFAAYRVVQQSRKPGGPLAVPRRAVAAGAGAAIGLLSGLTGVGGGIFLTPLLLLMRWAEPRQASGVSAAFVLVNSAAGLLALMARSAPLPLPLTMWVVAAGVGGWIGAEYGSRRFDTLTLRRLLAGVLVIAAYKLITAG